MADLNTRVHAFVLTGGPCAGKTSVLAYLKQELPEHGVQVVTVPEAARMLLASGVTPTAVGGKGFQQSLITLQRHHEAIYRAVAAQLPGDRIVLLCDRGTMDSCAYLDRDSWKELLQENCWDIVDLRDRSYHAVVHLVTAADGAEAFYRADDERLETAEEARELDRRTQLAWTGHPHLRIIDNSTDFDEKRHRVLATILHELGLPVPLEIERKYLIPGSWPETAIDGAVAIDIEQAYLAHPNEGERIRKRGEGSGALYFRAIKRDLRPGVREEREWQITPEEYYEALRSVPPQEVIRKRRYCFVYQAQYFELDCFVTPQLPFSLLEVELTSEHTSVILPPWVNAPRDVTDDPQYSNREISRRAGF